jgi:hypothetical protein
MHDISRLETLNLLSMACLAFQKIAEGNFSRHFSAVLSVVASAI